MRQYFHGCLRDKMAGLCELYDAVYLLAHDLQFKGPRTDGRKLWELVKDAISDISRAGITGTFVRHENLAMAIEGLLPEHDRDGAIIQPNHFARKAYFEIPFKDEKITVLRIMQIAFNMGQLWGIYNRLAYGTVRSDQSRFYVWEIFTITSEFVPIICPNQETKNICHDIIINHVYEGTVTAFLTVSQVLEVSARLDMDTWKRIKEAVKKIKYE